LLKATATTATYTLSLHDALPISGKQEQEPDAYEHGQSEADPSRQVPSRIGQLVHENGNEDDVVDAEHELERRQREEGDPGVRIEKQFHRKPEILCARVRRLGVIDRRPALGDFGQRGLLAAQALDGDRV